MMNNLEKVLSVFLKRVPVQEIIEDSFSPQHVKCEEFVSIMGAYSNIYSETELTNLYKYLTIEFKEQFYATEYGRKNKGELDIFGLLKKYSDRILIRQNDEIVCEYRKFLYWREITQELSEEMVVACFLASEKQKHVTEQVDFGWKTTITHNNWELHKILGKGIAENHSHLKGSSAIFQLTWIRLMDRPELIDRSDYIKKMEQSRRNFNMQYRFLHREKILSIQLWQAACIRFLLFQYIRKEKEALGEFHTFLQEPTYRIDMKNQLISSIHGIRNTVFYEMLPDYILVEAMKDGADKYDRTFILQGERWLLYRSFLEVFSETGNETYCNLFYAYLVIKENFRAEIVQNNAKIGFENFRIYESRKDVFLDAPVFQREVVKKVIERAFIESKAVVAEERIAPKESATEFYKYIKKLNEQIKKGRMEKYQHRLLYVVHFIKSEDKARNEGWRMCRHYWERQRYMKQAIGLAEFREKYPSYANCIKGIDAANMEIGCGPEVFAQIFRYLSEHRIILESGEKAKVPQLKLTYHVGEDFLDIVSGLRAIDEAMCFLGMRCGDRLGHVIALGIDVDEWYQGKNYRILLPQQEYLDNIVWMYHLCVLCNINNSENILEFLRREYEYYFQIIYKEAMDRDILLHINECAKKYYKGTKWEKYYIGRTYEFTIEDYFSAWQLRGDNPQLYEKGFYDNQSIVENKTTSFSAYSINKEFPRKQNKRYFQETAVLYYYYHFDEKVRKEGRKPIEKKVKKEYIQCVKRLQYELQKIVMKKGIAIETNPSSNVLISTFKRYDKHPIINFYNKYLIEDLEKQKECVQMNVSINTDDAGIFGTSLENEYAYIALALEREKDEFGNPVYKRRNIYEWLDHIREMGLRQTFLNDEEIKRAISEWSGEH